MLVIQGDLTELTRLGVGAFAVTFSSLRNFVDSQTPNQEPSIVMLTNVQKNARQVCQQYDYEIPVKSFSDRHDGC